jgi:hypothetical protein
MDHSALKIMRQKKTGPAFAKVGRRHLYFKADLDNWVIHRRQSSLLEPVELGLK